MPEVDPNNEATFKTCVIKSDLAALCGPKQAILSEVRKSGFSEDASFAIKLALEEALTNAVKHGNCGDASKKVIVRYAITKDRAVFIVRDEGGGFNPEAIPDCTCPERLPLPNGRGIMLMKAYMDSVSYRDSGREVYFAKQKS